MTHASETNRRSPYLYPMHRAGNVGTCVRRVGPMHARLHPTPSVLKFFVPGGSICGGCYGELLGTTSTYGAPAGPLFVEAYHHRGPSILRPRRVWGQLGAIMGPNDESCMDGRGCLVEKILSFNSATCGPRPCYTAIGIGHMQYTNQLYPGRYIPTCMCAERWTVIT